MPWDKSIWARMREPFFWLVFLISMVSSLGVRVGWWTFLFFLLDKFDEFQLCMFIITFKVQNLCFRACARAMSCLERIPDALARRAHPLPGIALPERLLLCKYHWNNHIHDLQ